MFPSPEEFSRPFLNGWNADKFLVEQKIVKNLRPSREKEGHVDPGGPRKHEPDKQRAEGGACGARDSRKSTRSRSLFGRNDGHCIGLSGRNIHLTDAEPEKKHRHCP